MRSVRSFLIGSESIVLCGSLDFKIDRTSKTLLFAYEKAYKCNPSARNADEESIRLR